MPPSVAAHAYQLVYVHERTLSVKIRQGSNPHREKSLRVPLIEAQLKVTR